MVQLGSKSPTLGLSMWQRRVGVLNDNAASVRKLYPNQETSKFVELPNLDCKQPIGMVNFGGQTTSPILKRARSRSAGRGA